MSEHEDRRPVTTADELAYLDSRDVLHGYLAGLHGRDEPGVEFNRDYWHGWRNGMVDSGRMPKDAAMSQLAADAAPNGRMNSPSTARPFVQEG